MIGWWLALWVAGCGGSEDPCDDPALTWHQAGEPFLDTWCTPCHSSAVTDQARLGAPVGNDYDTWSSVVPHASAIRDQLTTDPPRMPPAGGADPVEIERFVDWLDCGLPGGEAEPVAACDVARPVPGDVVADSGLCSVGTVAVAGNLEVSSEVDVSCVCRVGGALEVVGAGEIALSQLASVHGTVTVTGGTQMLRMPRLTSIGGLSSDADLELLDLQALKAVGGDLRVQGSALSRLSIDHVVTIGGTLHVSAAPSLEVIRVDRLERVAGDLILSQLPALQRWQTTHGLVEIGGRLEIDDAPALSHIDGLSALSTAGGDLVLTRTGARSIRGIDRLLHVPGDVRIEDHPALTELSAIADLATVDGDLVIRDLSQLATVDTFVFVTHVGGDLVIEGNDALKALPTFTTLERVGGDLVIRDNPLLPSAAVTELATSVTVKGAVVTE
ncbi:MAG: hypothetical protein KTR31_31955 [Myxococcales bacterium]|nr:hypothetical protein [Myxococcales bacterium]